MNFVRMLLAAVLFVGTVTPACAAPPQPTALSDTMAAIGAWSTKIDAAIALSNNAYAEAAPAISREMASMRDPAQARAAAARLRPIIGEVREALQQADALLASAGPPPAALFVGGKVDDTIMADARKQNRALGGLLDSTDAMLAALVAGDAAKVRVLAPRLIEGGFVLIDGQAVMMHSRQLRTAPTTSAHQALGVGRAIYLGFAVAARAAAAVQFNPGTAVELAPARDRLESLARNVVALSKTGRANLAREEREFRADQATLAGASAADRASIQQLGAVMTLGGETFAVADDLAAVFTRLSMEMTVPKIKAASMKGVIAPLAEIEGRYQDVIRRQTALFSKPQPTQP